MPPDCGNSRICRLLPDLHGTTHGGKHHAHATCCTGPQARHVKPPSQELTASPSLYPFRGSFKRLQQVFASRTFVWSLAWAVTLWMAASVVGLLLVATGASLPRWPALLA